MFCGELGKFSIRKCPFTRLKQRRKKITDYSILNKKATEVIIQITTAGYIFFINSDIDKSLGSLQGNKKNVACAIYVNEIQLVP